jgi:hopene-associated glycosyltransferase HpnB
LTALAVSLFAVWLYILAFRLDWGRVFRPRPFARSVPLQPKRLSVAAVIPARNEAACIGEALESLAKQQFSGLFRMVVVDDQSEDATAVIASRYASVIRAAPLPEGWTGKLWAVAQGVSQAGAPDFFLLTDADIVHAPDNLDQLAARAEREGYDLVSYMVELRAKSFAEKALIPAFVFFFFLLYPPHWIRGRRFRTAGAAGGCMLIRREMLERIGGIAAIRGEWIDDCALAGAVKRAGGRVWLGLTRSARSIREYGGFGDVGSMIARTAFTQLRHSAALLAATLIALAFVYLLPPALALAGNPYAAAAWLLMSLAYLPAVRFYRQSPLWALALPLIAAFYMACTVLSAAQYWRGRGGGVAGAEGAGARRVNRARAYVS